MSDYYEVMMARIRGKTIFTEREAMWRRVLRVGYHLGDGLGPNGLLGPYNAEQTDMVHDLLDDLRAVADWLDAQSEMPEPDWADAPDDAVAWAVDADGYAHWFVDVPSLEVSNSEWATHRFMEIEDAGHVILPLGIDWRTTLRHRSEASK